MRKLLIILLFPVFAKAQFTLPSNVGFNKPQSAAPLSPKDTAGLLLWVYSDTLGLSNNDPVSTWTDLSGNSNNATQTGSARPTYKTNIQNGKAALLFELSSAQFMEVSSTSLTSGLSGMTIFAVVKFSDVTGNKSIMTKWDYNTQGSWGIKNLTPDQTQMYVADSCNDPGNNHQDATNANLANTDFYVLTYVYDGSQSTNADRVKIYKNGTLVSMSVTGTIPTSLTSCSATVKIGDFGGSLNSWLFDGYMGEIFIYDHALTPTGITTWNDWLKRPARWGL